MLSRFGLLDVNILKIFFGKNVSSKASFSKKHVFCIVFSSIGILCGRYIVAAIIDTATPDRLVKIP